MKINKDHELGVKKTFTFKRVVFVLCGFIVLAAFMYFEPFKIRDPNDPRFNPDRFSFSDYSGKYGDLLIALSKTFPVGTSLEYVEKVMGKKADEVRELKHGYVAYFNYKVMLRYSHMFIFDKNMMLVNVKPYLNIEIYENQPKMDDLRGGNGKIKKEGN